jgi:hypothetical protein
MQHKLVSINFEKVKNNGAVTCWLRVQIHKDKENITHEDFIIPSLIGRSMIKTLQLKKRQDKEIEYYLLNEKDSFRIPTDF